MPSIRRVYTPSRAVPTLSQHEFDMQRKAPKESPQEHGQDFGRRPRHSRRPPKGSPQKDEGISSCTQGPRRRPEAMRATKAPVW